MFLSEQNSLNNENLPDKIKIMILQDLGKYNMNRKKLPKIF